MRIYDEGNLKRAIQQMIGGGLYRGEISLVSIATSVFDTPAPKLLSKKMEN